MRTVTININQRCPLSCKHCSIGFSESYSGNKTDLSPEKLTNMIRSIDPKFYQMVVLAGGEPSLSPKLIRQAISICKETNFLCAIVTAPVWAKSTDTASRFLDRVTGINFIILSYDDYHLEFLSIEFYRNAMICAVQRGIKIIFQIAYTQDEQLERLIESLKGMNVLSTQINTMRTVLVGNARTSKLNINEILINNSDDIDKIPRGCVLGNSFIDDHMNLHGCCWSTVTKKSPFSIKEKISCNSNIFQELENDPVFQSVKNDGFINSLSVKNKEKVVEITKGTTFSCECDLCIKMMEDGDEIFWKEISEKSNTFNSGII